MTTPRFSLAQLTHPIVQAPLAGGPSTPALAAAVSEAGGLGFLAAGYKPAAAVAEDIAALRAVTGRPFGVNLFAPPGRAGDSAELERYAAALAREAEGQGAAVGEPRHDDDGWEEKLALVARERVPIVSFTFGCPAAGTIAALQDSGAAVWVTVTSTAEAQLAADADADALVVQGAEAGGHRGSFDDSRPNAIGLLALLQLIPAAGVALPLIATGGVMTGRAIAAVLAAGAAAAQLGSAFMLTPEAGTAPAHREALARADAGTALTRAFSGRTARGIVNRFLREHDADAPRAYPEVHYMTAPLRAAARSRGDADAINLWAGQAHPLAQALPAGELVVRLAEEARTAGK